MLGNTSEAVHTNSIQSFPLKNRFFSADLIFFGFVSEASQQIDEIICKFQTV